MKVLSKTKSKYCGNSCLTDEMRGTFFIVTNFMLGDADSEITKIQGSFKRITKEMINIVLALEVSVDKNTDEMTLTEFLNLPYSESSYWSFQSYSVMFLDKSGDVFDVALEFEEDELAFIKSEKIYK